MSSVWHLTPEDDGSGFFTNMIYGISEALAGTPYHLVVTPYSLEDQMAPIRHIVETHAADGIIISRVMPNDPRVEYLAQAKIPFVTHGRTEMGMAHCYYDFDNHAFASEALRLLWQRGRRNPVLFGPPANLTYARHVLAGFQEGTRIHGLKGRIIRSVDSDSPAATLRGAALELAKSLNPPDAVVCTSAREAVAVASGFRVGGMEMGRDYDLVAKPASELTRLALPQMIGIAEDHRAADRELARMLMALVGGEPVSRLQVVVGPSLA